MICPKYNQDVDRINAIPEDPNDMLCQQCHKHYPIHSLVLSDKQLSSLKVVFKAVLNNDRFKDQYQFRVISMLIRHIDFKDIMG
jgi:hypothetical protein